MSPENIAKPADVPISTDQLIKDLTAGRVQSTGSLSMAQLQAVQISLTYGSASFPIAVLIDTLLRRDQEIRDQKAWIWQYNQNSDQIGKHLERVRRKRYTGEPARSDQEEVRDLVNHRQYLLTVLDKVEKYMSSEDGPLYRRWEDCEIGQYEGHELNWEDTLAQVRDASISAADLGTEGDCEEVRLYREVLAAFGTTSKEEV